jgi:hypothetical protein
MNYATHKTEQVFYHDLLTLKHVSGLYFNYAVVAYAQFQNL